MLGRVVVENGVKKIVPLTADCGSGNPVGTVIAVYSNKVPNGYLPCNGVAFDTAQFPVLYALLQDDHTPDLRECTLKGIGESGRTVGAHVKTGGLAVGEFIDDQVQEHKHDYVVGEVGVSGTPAYYTGSNTVVNFHNAHSTNNNGRSGATTEVKAVGVNWCIKATSGINENQADNVLSALTPVNEVTANNVHSVTSGAVANVFTSKQRITRFLFVTGEQSAGVLPIKPNDYYNDNPNIYLDGNKIKFRASGRYLLLLHIIGRTGTSGRLFFEVTGGNLNVDGIAYGEYAESDIILPTQVDSNTEIYVTLHQDFNVGGGQLATSYIALSPL